MELAYYLATDLLPVGMCYQWEFVIGHMLLSPSALKLIESLKPPSLLGRHVI